MSEFGTNETLPPRQRMSLSRVERTYRRGYAKAEFDPQRPSDDHWSASPVGVQIEHEVIKISAGRKLVYSLV
jgi:hypothetical protein